MPNPLLRPLLRWLRRLSYPKLFVGTALLFAVNIFIPDPIPFIDELLLGLATVLLANWKDRKGKPGETIEGNAKRS